MDCSHRTVEYQEWAGDVIHGIPKRSLHFKCVICDYEFGMSDYGEGRMSLYPITCSEAEAAREKAFAQVSDDVRRSLEVATLARRVWPPHSPDEAKLLKQHGAVDK